MSDCPALGHCNMKKCRHIHRQEEFETACTAVTPLSTQPLTDIALYVLERNGTRCLHSEEFHVMIGDICHYTASAPSKCFFLARDNGILHSQVSFRSSIFSMEGPLYSKRLFQASKILNFLPSRTKFMPQSIPWSQKKSKLFAPESPIRSIRNLSGAKKAQVSRW